MQSSAAMGGIDNDLPFNTRQKNLIAVTAFCIIISTIAVALRLLARRQFNVNLWWDDYVAVIALFFSYFPNILTIMGIRAGLGRHAADISIRQAQYIGITIYVHQSAWYISFTAIIVTILILYVRIFPIQWLHRVSYGMGLLTVLWMVINLIVLTFQCTPVEYFWNRTRKGGGHCIHANEYYAISCGVSMVMLIFVFFLPIPIVRKLQITRSKKWGLGVAFGVGAFACVASVMRLVLVLDIEPQDQAWSIAPAILWGCLETSIGVVSACIPSLMPLFMMIIGLKHKIKDSVNRGYVKYENGNVKPSTTRTNRFRRFLTMRDLETLPEALDLFSLTETTTTRSEDDVGLVDSNKKPGAILVTNDILVSGGQPKPPDAKPGESNKPWDAQIPADAHVR